MSCPNAANVNIVSFPEGVCLPVEGCPDGPPVEVSGTLIPSFIQSAPIVLSVANQAADLNIAGYAGGTISLQADAAFNGMVEFFVSEDGITFFRAFAVRMDSVTGAPGEGWQTRETMVPNDTFLYKIRIAGNAVLRARLATVASGSVTVILSASVPGDDYQPLIQNGFQTTNYGIPVRTSLFCEQGGGNWVPMRGHISVLKNIAAQFANLVGVESLGYLYDPVTDTQSVVREVNIFKNVAANANGNTALWTPAAGKKFRLMRYCLAVTGNAAAAAAGTKTFSLFDGAAGAIGQAHAVFIPGAALNAGALYTGPWIDLGNGILSSAANNVLNVNLSAALTAGFCNVIACGTEE